MFKICVQWMLLISICATASFSLADSSCKPSNCHGASFTCGEEGPNVCTMVYMFDDVCRKFARCEKIDSVCQLISDSHYDSCVACAEGCRNNKQRSCDCLQEFEQASSDLGKVKNRESSVL